MQPQVGAPPDAAQDAETKFVNRILPKKAESQWKDTCTAGPILEIVSGFHQSHSDLGPRWILAEGT